VFGPSPPDHPATAALPQHGFARSSRWEYLGKSTSESSAKDGAKADDSSVKMDFGLSHSNLDEVSKKAWPFDFGLIYSVTLSREGLETSILVRNEGTEAWDFQVLFHTYLRIKVCTSLNYNQGAWLTLSLGH
jgi:glucose-6-phosphate 1-epimerase